MTRATGKCERARQTILKLLQEQGTLALDEVCSALHCSVATVRRHFAELEQQGLLIRTHGGVRALPPSRPDYSFATKSNEHSAVKRRIGAFASCFIRDGGNLFLDSGTTVFECGKALAVRLRDELAKLTLVTNSMAVGSIFPVSCKVLLTGGLYRPERMDLCGPVALEQLSRHHFSMAILGADGIDGDGSLSTEDEETALLASTAVAHSDRVLVLADSSKLFHPSFVTYANLVDPKVTLLTDHLLSAEKRQTLDKLGVHYLLTDE